MIQIKQVKYQGKMANTTGKSLQMIAQVIHQYINIILKNLVVNIHKEQCAHEKFYGRTPKLVKYLITFGEMCVVRSILKVQFKLEYIVIMCMILENS